MQDSLLSRLSDALGAQMGLYFPPNRWGDLARGIAAAAPRLGTADAESCARQILSAPLTQGEIEILASCLTVGETYFLRDQRSLEVLERHILAELVGAREHTTRRLRLWSAGCCTGEEPYTLAMILDRLIPDTTKWDITLLGTDINPLFLRKAAQGIYGDWSFRDTPGWVRERYFQRTRAGRYELDSRIRKRVTFSYLNLADDSYPSPASKAHAMDVILCRNVLMYFSAAQAAAVVENLYRTLVDGGWLIVGPAETSGTLLSAFTAVEFDGVLFYCKPDGMQAPAAGTWPQNRDSAAELLATPAPQQAIPPLTPPAIPLAPRRPAGAATPATQEQANRTARDYANQGRLDEAIIWCEQAITADKFNPGYHYLLATILQEQGQFDAAAQSLTQALYLNQDFALAHFALGALRLAQGRQQEAERCYTTTLAVLHKRPLGETLPESDGLTAGGLIEIVESALANLPRATAKRARAYK